MVAVRITVYLALLLLSIFPAAAYAAQADDFDSLARSATAARESGKTEDAIQEYRRAIELGNDWEEGWWYLGTLLYDTNRFKEAIPAFHSVVQLDPSLASAWTFLGLCEFETADYDAALTHLEKGAAASTGDDPELTKVASFHHGLLLIRASEFERAAAILSGKQMNQASEEVKVALGLALLHIPLLPQQVDPSQDALVHGAGELASLLRTGRQATRLDAFPTFLNKYPKTPYLHYEYGRALATAGRLDEAVLAQQEEMKLSPDTPLPLIEISLLDLRLRRSEDALRMAKEAVRIAPKLDASHAALAQVLDSLGHTSEAAAERYAAETLSKVARPREERILQLYAQRSVSRPTEATPTGVVANFDELARRAAVLESEGNAGSAISAYEDALRVRPDWNDGLWHLAMLCYSMRNYQQTVAALKTFVERNPDQGTAWAVMGLSEYELKDFGNARIHLQRGQELGLAGSADSVQLARYRLGLLLNRDSEFDHSTELLAKVAGKGPLAKQVEFALGMALLRIPGFPEQVEQPRADLVQASGAVAILLQNSKYDDALTRLRSLLQRYPDTPFLHYVYGTALMAISQFEEAESEFRQEIAKFPNSPLAYRRLASLNLRRQRPADALPIAKRAVEMGDDSAEAHYLLGRCYLETGNEKRAITELRKGSELAPSSPEVHFTLARAYAKANLPAEEKQEREIFIRLNALAETERGRRGSQAYGAHDSGTFAPAADLGTPDPAPR